MIDISSAYRLVQNDRGKIHELRMRLEHSLQEAQLCLARDDPNIQMALGRIRESLGFIGTLNFTSEIFKELRRLEDESE